MSLLLSEFYSQTGGGTAGTSLFAVEEYLKTTNVLLSGARVVENLTVAKTITGTNVTAPTLSGVSLFTNSLEATGLVNANSLTITSTITANSITASTGIFGSTFNNLPVLDFGTGYGNFNTVIGRGFSGGRTATGLLTSTTTEGDSNVIIGFNAALPITTGRHNTSVGTDATRLITTGTYNASFGQASNNDLTTGSYNTAVGAGAGMGQRLGSYNTCIGYLSRANATAIDSATNNTIIGALALANGYNNSILLGYEAQATASNQFIVGSSTSFLSGMINGNLATKGDFVFGSSERPSLTGIKQALDNFLYVTPSVSFVRINGAPSVLLEVGAPLTNPSITWQSNKTEQQAIATYNLTRPDSSTQSGNFTYVSDNTALTIQPTTIPGTATQLLSSWTASLVDWKGTTASGSASVAWQYRVYFGKVSAATPTAAQILAGVANDTNRPLATGVLNLGKKTITSLSNEYYFVAFPARFGTLTRINVNGLAVTSIVQQTINSFTNASNGTADYYVYRAPNPFTGTVELEVLTQS